MYRNGTRSRTTRSGIRRLIRRSEGGRLCEVRHGPTQYRRSCAYLDRNSLNHVCSTSCCTFCSVNTLPRVASSSFFPETPGGAFQGFIAVLEFRELNEPVALGHDQKLGFETPEYRIDTGVEIGLDLVEPDLKRKRHRAPRLQFQCFGERTTADPRVARQAAPAAQVDQGLRNPRSVHEQPQSSPPSAGNLPNRSEAPRSPFASGGRGRCIACHRRSVLCRCSRDVPGPRRRSR